MLGQLCDALQVAHDMDIVHRDLKPPNLMLQDGPSPGQETLKILDFGIAKILNSTDPSDNLTQLGQSLGTPYYMSPEQIGGDIEAVKATSDIYSVGVILYQLLTGYLPFTGGQNLVFVGHLYHPPPPFAEKNPEVHVPPEVEALVLRCLAKDPKRRPPSARALAEEFHRLVAPPSEPSPSSPAHRLHHRRSWLTLAGVMTVGVLGVPLLLWIRTPFPRPFMVTPEPASLEVTAGEDAQSVRLRISGGQPGTKVDVSFPDRPVDVETGQVGTFFGELIEFQVRADLNARPTSEPIALKLRVQAGRNARDLSIPLTIVPPTVAPLPAGFQAAEGSKLRKLANTKIYPDRIVRHLSDRLSVIFLLIDVDPGEGGPTSPFYIMENKVWNELLDAFLEAKRGARRRTHSIPSISGARPCGSSQGPGLPSTSRPQKPRSSPIGWCRATPSSFAETFPPASSGTRPPASMTVRVGIPNSTTSDPFSAAGPRMPSARSPLGEEKKALSRSARRPRTAAGLAVTTWPGMAWSGLDLSTTTRP